MTQPTDIISVDAFGQPLPAGGTIKLTANPDGTVGFDASALYGKLGYLAEGETVSVTFYYTAQMANGTYSVAIDPRVAHSVVMGANTLEIPAGAICAIGSSGRQRDW